MKKILIEVLKLLWKALKIVFWKWIRPRLGKIAMAVGLFLAVITVLTVLIMSSC